MTLRIVALQASIIDVWQSTPHQVGTSGSHRRGIIDISVFKEGGGETHQVFFFFVNLERSNKPLSSFIFLILRPSNHPASIYGGRIHRVHPVLKAPQKACTCTSNQKRALAQHTKSAPASTVQPFAQHDTKRAAHKMALQMAPTSLSKRQPGASHSNTVHALFSAPAPYPRPDKIKSIHATAVDTR